MTATSDNSVPHGYESAQEALADLHSLSAMLENVRANLGRLGAAYGDLDRLAERLTRQRKEALGAIDAITESAPRVGASIPEQLDRTAAGFDHEVDELLREASAIVAAAGRLDDAT